MVEMIFVFGFEGIPSLITFYGEVAQLARACGSYPQCRGFESPLRYYLGRGENVDFTVFSLLFCFLIMLLTLNFRSGIIL